MRKYTHLSNEERDQLFVLLQNGITNKEEISRRMNRDPTTIRRELKRNKTMIGTKHNNNSNTKDNPENFHYIPDRAKKKYLKRRKDSKQKCFLKTLPLFRFTLKELQKGLSPELIAGRAKLEGIGDISHECIYQFIYSKKGKELQLYQHLTRAHMRRKKQKGRKHRKSHIPNRIGIELRPEGANTREEFGHWETDSILGKGKRSALNTNRERMSRYIFVTKIPRKTAKETRKAICRRFQLLPLSARLSNTADNGSEFSEHEKVTKSIGMTFYFADPYASYQRGTNENGNGLVRRFFPKKTDFNTVTNKQIQSVEDWINHRPMKCLGYKTPHEVFHEELSLY
ncbi:IS30 family transposase [Candidatus Peregrinibacteria bacterium]|nr:IS30 family transposase [Candidatus Peregrinibacteria bacterium]MBT3599067.1 IS30 family transposase [Candidatus Peregrinibacteria bacterium]MBT4367698.1 IS30 family transposase [Candidatus Peregrinibacteria bacterium]MBT4585616.1 IS30 family transposase [Candidatus Peregrinibacteria bacterium]MBT6730373.1 IS30 family transposase [Candidatus Peregrinibacteria bacterium]